MNVFVCFDGDHIGRQVGRAVLSDDVSEVRRVDQAIQHGNEIWKSFALRAGGSVIEIGGDEGRIEIAVGHLPELPAIVKQYEEAVGATVSVGIGMKLSESAKALMVAKLRGGRQVLLWTQDMEVELSAARQKPESEKIADEYLNKADEAKPTANQGATAGMGQHQPGGNQGAHAGFGGHRIPSGATVSKPTGGTGDHEEGQAIQSMVADAQDNAPAAPEQTHAAQDFEDELHQQASSQEKSDQDTEVSGDKHMDDLKGQVAQVLMSVRQQAPVLAQMRQAAPEAFGAVMNLVQAVIQLGREITSQDQPPVDDKPPAFVQKSEELSKALPKFSPQQGEFDQTKAHDPVYLKSYMNKDWLERVSMVDPETDADDLEWQYHPGFETAKVSGSPGYKDYLDNDRHEEWKGGYTPKSKDPYAHFSDWLKSPHRQPLVLFQTKGGVIQPADGSHRLGYMEEHGVTHAPAIVGYQKKRKAEDEYSGAPATKPGGELDKSGGPIPGSPNHHHMNLPAGSQVNGKVKVQHSDGTESWVQLGSGMIQGQEADAPLLGMNSHPVSSREPGAR